MTLSARRIGLAVVLLLGTLDAWRFRHDQANPDGVSYVDMALGFAAGEPGALVSGYWSPLLPAFIGLAYRLAPPTLDTMYLVAHVVGFGLFVIAALSFSRLLLACERHPAVSARVTGPWRVALAGAGWSAFALYILKGIGVQLVSPDIGVAAIVFWLAAETLDLTAAPWTARRWALNGAVLGVGYWMKAILFPVGIAWFAAAAVLAWRRRDAVGGPGTGAAIYAVFALALLVPVSLHTGRVTFGEVGRLNYLWYANAAPYVWERCLPPGIADPGSARFGPIARDSLIAAEPVTCVVDSPTARATMPLWDDPSRYYRDAHVQVDVPRQLQAVRNSVTAIVRGVVLYGPVLMVVAAAVLLALVTTAAPRTGAAQPFTRHAAAALLTLTVVPVAAYALVYVEFRHVAPFLSVAIALVPCAAIVAWRGSRATVAYLLLAAAVIDVSWKLSTQTLIGFTLLRATVTGRAPEWIPETHTAARALRAAGLAPGARVAAVNDAWNPEWAQLAQLRIRAHVPEVTTSIRDVVAALSDGCRRAQWDAVLRRHGIEAAVALIPAGIRAPPTFERLGDTEFHLHSVPATTAAAPGAGDACAPAPTRSSSGTGER